MNPFRRRPREIVVTHRIEGLAEILDALDNLARARVSAAEIARRPWRPKPPPVPEPAVKPVWREEFETWLAAQAFPEAQQSHYAALFDVMVGARKESPPRWTRASAVGVLKAAGAPLPV